MKNKLFLLIGVAALWLATITTTHAQTAPTNAPTNAPAITPQQMADLGGAINTLLPFLPAKAQGYLLAAITLIGTLATIGRLLHGTILGSVLAWLLPKFTHGLVFGTNTPTAAPGQTEPLKTPRQNGLGLIALLLGLSLLGANAQTAPAVATTNPPASFWHGLNEAGQGFVNLFKGDTNALTATTWVAIPFASFDISQQKAGGGLALVYPISGTPLFVGGRIENLNGTWTVPSLQVQLKKPVTVSGFSVTPFAVGGTAIVSGNVAAYTGLGVYVDFYDFAIKGNAASLGLCGDYENWGGLPAPCGTKRVNLGLAGSVKF